MHICFFDIDGTLLLTGGAGQAAFAKTLAEDFSISEIDATVPFAGRSDRAIAMDLFRKHGIEPSEKNWLRFRDGYLRWLEQMLHTHRGTVLPGVVELLAILATRGDVAIGLLTGNLKEGARRKLGHYGLWQWFRFGGYGDEFTERRDIATAALAAAKSHLNGGAATSGFNSQSRDCLLDKADTAWSGEILVIGDTPHDVECGRSIEARCIAVSTGQTPASLLQKAEPDVLIDTLRDVEPILSLLK
jgi:phosphoglycolate phosphatase-like HAD superfamily hydrolase